MTIGKTMDSDFLKDSRKSTYSSDKRKQTITWDCTPGKVFYNYVVPGGSTQRKGYYAHDGVHRYVNGAYSSTGKIRKKLFEGVKCVKLQYRKNGGAWSTISDSKGLTSTEMKRTFTSSKNGEVYEIKATYQVWTMGMPFRDVPFMWFGTLTGWYNEGMNRFSQSTPANPGRTWSGMRDYTKSGNAGTDKNDPWKVVRYSWYQPNSSSKSTNWSYLHSQSYSSAWLSTYACEKWVRGMPYGKDMGWTGNVTGIAPQGTRKSSWWTFERTFTDKITTSNIQERPLPLTAPTVDLTVVNNLTNANSNNVYSGISGTVKVLYKQSAGAAGTYKLYAYQQNPDGTLYSVKVSEGSIGNNQTKAIDVSFTSHPELKRSKNIAYYATVHVHDSEYGKDLTGHSVSSITWLNMASDGTHYYNEEPLYSDSFVATGDDKDDMSKIINLNWTAVTDPDNHTVYYDIIVARDVSKYKPVGKVRLRIKSTNGYVERDVEYHDIYSNSTNKVINTSKYVYGEKINIYLKPRDKYYNNYYYANVTTVTCSRRVEIELNVIDNMTAKSGDVGTIQYTYKNKKGLPANIDIYAYIASAKGVKSETGTYVKRVFTSDPNNAHNIVPGTYTVSVNFNDYEKMKRGYYIKYFAVARDSEDFYSYIPYSYSDDRNWTKATGYHYFNSLPTAVSPFITESSGNIWEDDTLEIAWPKSTDLENHVIYYRLYIEVEGNAKNSDTFYTSETSAGEKRNYTKFIELGNSTFPTSDNPYLLPVEDFIGKETYIWIRTNDEYKSKKYLSGKKFSINNPGVAPEVPEIILDYAYSKDLFGDEKIDGEKGYVSASYNHPAGRNGEVLIYGMCKNPQGKIYAPQQPITSYSLSSGIWSPDILIDFKTAFGNEWRGSEIHYYAVARTIAGEMSVPEDWKPNASMWDKWTASHVFNEEPNDVTIAESSDELSDLHERIIIEWPASDDPDSVYEPKYAVAFLAKGDPRASLAIINGADNTGQSVVKSYTELWDISDTKIEIDLRPYDEGEEFEVFIVPHDDFANSYYYMSNILTFSKVKYGKPSVKVELTQSESERGTITLEYSHSDVIVNADGTYTFIDDNRADIKFFNGKVSIYCFIDDEYTINFALKNLDFIPGDKKSYKIEFSDVSPFSRSHNIRYFIVATDVFTEVRNTDTEPEAAEPYELTDYFHYYNDEPYDPVVEIGPLLSTEDKQIYGFKYVNLVWESPLEPDGDQVSYFVYVNTLYNNVSTLVGAPETVRTANITNRNGPNVVKYTRKYRVTETYNLEQEITGARVEYYDEMSSTFKEIQHNPFVGIRIDYDDDHLHRQWMENIEYSVYVEARDNRPLTNSYYGLSEEFVGVRKKHVPPNEVQIEVIYNLTDTAGDGETGRMKVTYTHKEGDVMGIVDIYAYQDDKPICNIYSGDFVNDVPQNITINFTEFELLNRSKDITYYAVATDKLVGYTSLDPFRIVKKDEEDVEVATVDEFLKYIPRLEPDENGEYNYHEININGTILDFNENGKYKGPVQKVRHYYNEEPPSTSAELYNEEIISYKSAEVKWPHVIDPDAHDVSYEIYVAASDGDEAMNTLVDTFYNDDIPNPDDVILEQESDNGASDSTVTNTVVAASGELKYHKVVKIPSSLAAEAAAHFSLATEEYSEDTTINIWIVSKDQYLNSYYRAGNILSLNKGHAARDLLGMYPRNGSTVYATQPRILLYLGQDNQKQTVYVGWAAKEYNNKDNPELFSSPPNNKCVVVFKPPVASTDLPGAKVSYYAYVHNQCGYSNKMYSTYTYENFFETFTEERLIAIKSDHINAFRKAVDITRDAYGLLTYKYTRDIKKNMIFENFDFNETKDAMCGVNNLLNEADDSDGLDYNNPLIVDMDDLDVTNYEGSIEAGTYKEFLEWARLVYILENL